MRLIYPIVLIILSIITYLFNKSLLNWPLIYNNWPQSLHASAKAYIKYTNIENSLTLIILSIYIILIRKAQLRNFFKFAIGLALFLVIGFAMDAANLDHVEAILGFWTTPLVIGCELIFLGVLFVVTRSTTVGLTGVLVLAAYLGDLLSRVLPPPPYAISYISVYNNEFLQELNPSRIYRFLAVIFLGAFFLARLIQYIAEYLRKKQDRVVS